MGYRVEKATIYSESAVGFEENYEIDDRNIDDDDVDCTVKTDVEMANAFVSQHPFRKLSFICGLDFVTLNALEFSEYMNTCYRETVIAVIKGYTIHRGVSYRVYESIISQDHYKLDSDTIAEAIKLLAKVDPSLKVQYDNANVQAKFNHTVSYRKVWLAKQKAVERIFGGWKASYEALSM
ncbi:hypothetical protein Ahy_A07g036528 [Arachis hypogaea]|uniref:Uncharacterized protein n=1 Tax=Arachis hypogaea TaxID=3818 RepID=A0A445CGG0_ARAHY|nr:hypothetical protein Ahy_A07g036528 [Arachis hypogaea]